MLKPGIRARFILCPVCQQPEAVYRHGKATDGAQRSHCAACRRTFQRRSRHQILDMALNSSGSRDTARVLGSSTQALMAELKKDGAGEPVPPCGRTTCPTRSRPGAYAPTKGGHL